MKLLTIIVAFCSVLSPISIIASDLHSRSEIIVEEYKLAPASEISPDKDGAKLNHTLLILSTGAPILN